VDQIQAGMSLNEDRDELEMERVGRSGETGRTGRIPEDLPGRLGWTMWILGWTRWTLMDKEDTWITYMDNPPY